MLIDTKPPTIMDYDAAIDLAFKIQKNESDGWQYKVEIEAATGKAKIAVLDSDYVKLGYL